MTSLTKRMNFLSGEGGRLKAATIAEQVQETGRAKLLQAATTADRVMERSPNSTTFTPPHC